METLVIVGAAAPFAPTAYARARLIRQLHASGLLCDEPALHVQRRLAREDSPAEPHGAPR